MQTSFSLRECDTGSSLCRDLVAIFERCPILLRSCYWKRSPLEGAASTLSNWTVVAFHDQRICSDHPIGPLLPRLSFLLSRFH